MHFRILTLHKIDSTQTYSLALAREGISEGTVVVSDYQTKGRGRYHRKWVSPRGKNLLFSIVLRPRLKVHASPLLTYLAARAVKETLTREAQVQGVIKKPNDVLINGRKVCGILTESHSRSGVTDYVVIGVGINVNSKRSVLVRGATSLLDVTGKETSLEGLLTEFLRIFAKHYYSFLKKG